MYPFEKLNINETTPCDIARNFQFVGFITAVIRIYLVIITVKNNVSTSNKNTFILSESRIGSIKNEWKILNDVKKFHWVKINQSFNFLSVHFDHDQEDGLFYRRKDGPPILTTNGCIKS